jgi:hypothetical protein
MTRINRPDTLLTELRDIKRRLRLLEAGRMRSPAVPALFAGAEPPLGTTLMPARPVDWPGTSTTGWEPLAATWTARGGTLVVLVAADADTAGEVRVVVDGAPVGAAFPVTPEPSRRTIAVAAGPVQVEVAVQGRRINGPGLVRATAQLVPEPLPEQPAG